MLRRSYIYMWFWQVFNFTITSIIRWTTCTSSLKRNNQSCAVPHPWFHIHHKSILPNVQTKKTGSLYNILPPYDKLPGLVCACGTVIQVGTVWRGPGKPENTLVALSRLLCAIVPSMFTQRMPQNYHGAYPHACYNDSLKGTPPKKECFLSGMTQITSPHFEQLSRLLFGRTYNKTKWWWWWWQKWQKNNDILSLE